MTIGQAEGNEKKLWEWKFRREKEKERERGGEREREREKREREREREREGERERETVTGHGKRWKESKCLHCPTFTEKELQLKFINWQWPKWQLLKIKNEEFNQTWFQRQIEPISISFCRVMSHSVFSGIDYSRYSNATLSAMFRPGVRVVRGQDWNWGTVDGYAPGTVASEMDANNRVHVHWDKGYTAGFYRVGDNGKFDLELLGSK